MIYNILNDIGLGVGVYLGKGTVQTTRGGGKIMDIASNTTFALLANETFPYDLEIYVESDTSGTFTFYRMNLVAERVGG